MKQSKLDFSHIPFLQSMPEEMAEVIFNKENIKHFKKGNYVFRENESSNALYIIVSGKMKLVRYDSQGREQIVGIFGTGESIWEGLLSEGSRFPFSGICLSSSQICIVEKSVFINCLKDSNLAFNIMAMLSQKLHDANERNILLSTKDPKEKLASFLLYRQNRDKEEAIELKLEDIAASLAIRPETVSRALSSLIQEGLVERVGKSKIKVKDYEGLKEAAYE